MEYYRNIKSFGSAIEKVKLENEIVNYLTSPRAIKEEVIAPPAINEGVDKFVLAVAVNNMKKKYNNLSDEQFNIIKESITTKDINKVKTIEQEKINEIKNSISTITDVSLKNELQEIVNNYKPIEDFTNESLIKTLSYFELAKNI